MDNIHQTDVILIGAGPVGLFTIFECGMARLRCHVVDALALPGGQCTALYPEKPIYDIPAYPKILAGDLIEQLLAQAAPFDPIYHLGQHVDGLTKESNGMWQVITSAGTRIVAPVVIIAAGVGAFGPNRPPLEGIETYESTGCVQYAVLNRQSLAGKRVMIAGGGDSAVDWAISLADIADVTVVHRRDKFRAAPDSENKLHDLARDGRLTLKIPCQLAGLGGHNGQLTHAQVEDMDGHGYAIPTDVLLPFYGLKMNLGPIAHWGLGLEKNHIVVDPSTQSTTSPGIFAVGDIVDYPGKLKLILTGFAEGALAAHSARAYIYPGEVRHFSYSTTQGVQGFGA